MSIENKLVSTFAVNQQAKNSPIRPASNNGNKSFSDVFASVKNLPPTPSNTNKVQSDTPISSTNNYRTHIINSARADSAEAEQLLAFNTAPENGAFPLIDISNWPTVRYSVSGELQTPESEAYFSEISKSASKARTELVQSERSKGTPAADILEKVLALNSALPPRYKAMANISY